MASPAKRKSFEDLSNELFYEIFDYFDSWSLYKAFANLNIRFQNLLFNCSYRFKINVSHLEKSDIDAFCRKFLIPNRHRIVSLHLRRSNLIDLLLPSITNNLIFEQVESIHLPYISKTILVVLLQSFILLPRLFFLDLFLVKIVSYQQGSKYDEYLNLTEIYCSILKLPVLKSIKISSWLPETKFPIAMNSTIEGSSLENIIIDHQCYLNDLINLLRHTPRLRRLICRKGVQTGENNTQEISFSLTNLISLSIKRSSLELNKFDTFLGQIGSNLKILHIANSSYENCFNGNQWEKILSKNFPFLKKFSLEFLENLDETFDLVKFEELISSFTSQHQWTIQITLTQNQYEDCQLKLVVQSQ
ncbi:unnamed protein product, partial [Adineta ricciae]